jgi:hypothetical protein
MEAIFSGNGLHNLEHTETVQQKPLQVCCTCNRFCRLEAMLDIATLPDQLSYADLSSQGLTRHDLDRLIESGEFERIAPGLFLRSGLTDDTTAAWIAIAAKKPDATLCLLTALSLHELTDEIPARSNIAIPRGTHPVIVHHAPISWHHFDADTFTIGRTDHALRGNSPASLLTMAEEFPKARPAIQHALEVLL